MKACINRTRFVLNFFLNKFNEENNVKLTTDTCTSTGISDDNDSDLDNWKKMPAVGKKAVPNKNAVHHSSLGQKDVFSTGSTGDSGKSESLL